MFWKKRLIQSILIINLMVVLAIWFPYSGRLIMDWYMENYSFGLVFKSIANLTGLLAAFFVLLQILLISRAKWLEKLFGLDKLARWHHVLGFLIPVFIVMHPWFLVMGSSMVNKKTYWIQFLNYLNFYEDVNKALIATILFLFLTIMSVVIVFKKLKYEIWYLAHLVMYLAVLLALGHQFEVGSDLQSGWAKSYWMFLYVLVFANLFYYRFFLPVYQSWKYAFIVQKVVPENQNCVSIYIIGKQFEKLKIKSGQFFMMRFLDRQRWWQAHPFSLSCAPNGQYLRFTIKNLGDYTSQLQHLKPGTRVYLDGPHGVFTLDKAVNQKFLLIAGGVGITPIRALAESLVKKSKDVIVLQAAKTSSDILFKQELSDMFEGQNEKLHFILSDQDDWHGEKGFIDIQKIQRLVPDYKERDIFICGPGLMMDRILKNLKKQGMPASQIHFEKFSL